MGRSFPGQRYRAAVVHDGSCGRLAMVKVAWLHVAPGKGLVIQERDHVMLGMQGVEEDRRFCVVDEAGRMLNGKRVAPAGTLSAQYEPATDRLALRMGDGAQVSGTVTVG